MQLVLALQEKTEWSRKTKRHYLKPDDAKDFVFVGRDDDNDAQDLVYLSLSASFHVTVPPEINSLSSQAEEVMT